ncbi:hypothetical protein [Vibrio phage vB_VmeM-Yong XC32]|nr:hypothetical protein [Vibrio phage vB_VmeM-Yong XC31]QAX96624.1 hypothetical protein [Vibrio phage vB_VmeM-Yong XC32]QAX96942.1 hypothetical protein [Vibrio phage vB_VmeM-Yong MS31]QAX97247.1 hypothetical protein [Vibrio phage vB_VmeM-Yong MS32]
MAKTLSPMEAGLGAVCCALITLLILSLCHISHLYEDINWYAGKVTILEHKLKNVHEFADELEYELADAEKEIVVAQAATKSVEASMAYYKDFYHSQPENNTFQPTLNLAPWQEELCLSILMYGEERAGTPLDAIKTANSVYQRVDLSWYETNACLVAAEGYGGQFESMKPYSSILHEIVWGKRKTFRPKSAKPGTADGTRWNQIVNLSKSIISGKEPMLLEATHFISMHNLSRFPNWVKYLRPVGVSSGHVFFTEYWTDPKTGKKIRYTKQNPFKQSVHSEGTWIAYN